MTNIPIPDIKGKDDRIVAYKYTTAKAPNLPLIDCGFVTDFSGCMTNLYLSMALINITTGQHIVYAELRNNATLHTTVFFQNKLIGNVSPLQRLVMIIIFVYMIKNISVIARFVIVIE